MRGEINRVDLGEIQRPNIFKLCRIHHKNQKGDLIAATPSGLINANNGNSVAEFPQDEFKSKNE